MTTKILSIFILLSLSISCTEDRKVSTALSGSSSTGSTGGSGTGSGSGGAAQYCTGTTQDGESDLSESSGTPNSLPLLHYEVNLAGGQSWKIGNNPANNQEDLVQAFQTLDNDGPYYIRFKVRESVIPPNNNEQFCPGRITGSGGWLQHYKHLRFKIYLHSYAVKFNESHQVTDYYKIGTGGEAGYYLTQTGLTGANNCSDIVKVNPLGANLPDDYKAVTIFEIKHVTSDSKCLYCQERGTCSSTDVDGFYCPDFAVRGHDCWSTIVQVSTSKTHFWKGQSRF